MSFAVSTDAFVDQGSIPTKFTCDGQDVSPHLMWQNIPAGTKSLVLIMDDPDAPGRTFVHWIVYDMPATQNELKENTPKTETLAGGAKQGINDFPRAGYGGPCPPRGHGVHRYYFKLYAVSKKLELAPKASVEEVKAAMEGHIIAQTQIMGRYSRK